MMEKLIKEILENKKKIIFVMFSVKLEKQFNLWLLLTFVGRWCRRDWSSPPDARAANDASRRVLYSSVFLGSPGKLQFMLNIRQLLQMRNALLTSFNIKPDRSLG